MRSVPQQVPVHQQPEPVIAVVAAGGNGVAPRRAIGGLQDNTAVDLDIDPVGGTGPAGDQPDAALR